MARPVETRPSPGADAGVAASAAAGTWIAPILAEAVGTGASGSVAAQDLTRFVNPFIGTDDSDSPFPVPGGAGGSTYPGAVVPFGMIQLSPDTPTASPSGYRYGDGAIDAFSVTHFDGAGCPNNEDLPFLPFVGALEASPSTSFESYRTGYDKASEKASPGRYAVTLESGVRVELTATTRTGLIRLQYPPSTASQFLIHAGRSATGQRAGSLEVLDGTRIRGTATAGGFCGTDGSFALHFALEFDRPATQLGTWAGGTLTPGATASRGEGVGGYLTFDTRTNPTLLAKIGISFVSVENAEANLAAESPGWDFDATAESARQRWDDTLHRVEVTGGDDEDLTKFYTALYHVFQSPNVASDVNGEYLGFDQAVHVADGFTLYQNYSGWDIIRSWTHLVSALAPEAPDIVRSMVIDGQQGGLLPFWTHQNLETRVMTGDPGSVNVANAYAMGVRGFDTAAALALMTRSATDPNATQRWGLQQWLDLHYLDDASTSLEYAMADFAIAEFAGALGDTPTRDTYLARSGWWRESWDDTTGFLRPRVVPGGAFVDAARIYEVEVRGPAAPATNLALAGTASASGECNESESAEQAINGSPSSGKWCDNTSADKWWQLDLGASLAIDQIVIHHAEAGGEDVAWNTGAFTLALSTNGTDFTPVATVTDNPAGTTTHDFPATRARYVRLEIVNAVQTRGAAGDFTCQPFDPASSCGYVEGNASQYVWMVPHDLEGLFELMGGHARAVERLDEHFTELNAGTERAYFYIGNEPEHGTPWTYNFAHAPWKTQEVVRRIVNDEFSTQPGGLPGNDDLGATSAWLVWAYLGMYPLIPGTDTLVLHGPRFSTTTLHLANGRTLTINGAGAGADAPYIQAASIDGRPATRHWLRYADLAGGATLDFVMGSSANESWGVAESD